MSQLNKIKADNTVGNPDARVKRWVRDDIRTMHAYEVPLAPGLLKLDAMENPYEWDEDIRDAWLQALKDIPLNRYPDASAHELVQRLRSVMEIPSNLEVILGNGSDELIQIIQMTLADDGHSVLAPVPSFIMYEYIARALRQKFIGVNLKRDFSLDLDRMIDTIKRETPSCVFIAYPNNPTGNCFASDAIDAIIDATDGLVIIDEAYYAFCDESYLKRVFEFENVVVMRSLSKIGLAGLRLGFLVGDRCWLNEFEKIRLPYNIGCLTQASVVFALDHYSVLRKQTQAICDERTRLYDELSGFGDIEVFPSQANFISFRSLSKTGESVYQALLKENILIKNLQRPDEAKTPGLLSDCLRVTVSSPKQNDIFLSALQKIIC